MKNLFWKIPPFLISFLALAACGTNERKSNNLVPISQHPEWQVVQPPSGGGSSGHSGPKYDLNHLKALAARDDNKMSPKQFPPDCALSNDEAKALDATVDQFKALKQNPFPSDKEHAVEFKKTAERLNLIVKNIVPLVLTNPACYADVQTKLFAILTEERGGKPLVANFSQTGLGNLNTDAHARLVLAMAELQGLSAALLYPQTPGIDEAESTFERYQLGTIKNGILYSNPNQVTTVYSRYANELLSDMSQRVYYFSPEFTIEKWKEDASGNDVEFDLVVKTSPATQMLKQGYFKKIQSTTDQVLIDRLAIALEAKWIDLPVDEKMSLRIDRQDINPYSITEYADGTKDFEFKGKVAKVSGPSNIGLNINLLGIPHPVHLSIDSELYKLGHH